MGDFEKGLRRLTLAGIGAVAKSVDDINAFFEGKEFKALDELAERGKKVISDGKDANDELHRKVEDKIDDFYDNHRRFKKEIDIASMTAEEREELLNRLQNFKEEPEEAEDQEAAEEVSEEDAESSD